MITLRIVGLLQGAWGLGLRKLTDVRMVVVGVSAVVVVCRIAMPGNRYTHSAGGIFGHLVKTYFPFPLLAQPSPRLNTLSKGRISPDLDTSRTLHNHFTMNDFTHQILDWWRYRR